jgi:uncharacterized protein YuzE
MIKQSYDLDADALYIELADRKVARTVEIDSGTLVNLDFADRVVGIEVIRTRRAWPLEEILMRFRVPEGQARELRAYFPQPPAALMPPATSATAIPPRTYAQPAHPEPGLDVAVG